MQSDTFKDSHMYVSLHPTIRVYLYIMIYHYLHGVKCMHICTISVHVVENDKHRSYWSWIYIYIYINHSYQEIWYNKIKYEIRKDYILQIWYAMICFGSIWYDIDLIWYDMKECSTN